MPRNKTYKRSDALNKAQTAFWKNGYESLGVRAIGELSGINRFALQTEFGGKQGLFLEVLEKYASDSRKLILDPISNGSLNEIIHFFKALTTQQSCDPRNSGCLMVNTVVENAGLGNSEIHKKTKKHYDGMLNALSTALNNAKSQGEVSADFDIPNSASFLLSIAMGIQVYVRMNGNVASATQQGEIAIQTINSWRS